mmetsp:Transcript_9530/g.7957  ORF Transcript_9530/g.7957 Transcript_9530/m.7957 type:complete len:82 (+) Transcript_9530:186-431(+)
MDSLFCLMYSSNSPSPASAYKSLSIAGQEDIADSLDNYFGVYDLHKAKDPRLVSDKSRILSNDPQPEASTPHHNYNPMDSL